MAQRQQLCRWDELEEGRGRRIVVAGLGLAVFRVGQEVAVMIDRCPHAGGSLGQGWVEGGDLVCPLHRWRFRIRDGRCLTDPGAAVHRFQCEVDDGVVWVWV